MRTHTYWKTYEEYLKWSFNPPKQINCVTKQPSKNGVRARGLAPAKGGLRGSISRIHINFID